MRCGNDMVGIDRHFDATAYNRLLHHFHRVFGQQLQDANVLSRPDHQAVALLEVFSQLLEAGRQHPAIEHERMIQGRRPATQNGQIMTWFYDPFPACVASRVPGNHPIARHYVNAIDIGFNRHRGEGPATWNAVAIGVESHRLILIDLRRFRDERIERV